MFQWLPPNGSPPPHPFGRGEQEGRRGVEINDTEAGFNKAGTEEEKEGGGTRAMASEGIGEVGGGSRRSAAR